MRQLSTAARLAWAELMFDLRVTLCFVAAVVGVLIPLALIYALKSGVIDQTVEALIEDPRNRQIIPIGTGVYDQSFFAQMAQRSDVAFVVPRTRSLNALADQVRVPDTRRRVNTVTLVPTALGDPVLPLGSAGSGQVAISRSLADELDVSAGGIVELLISRSINGIVQSSRAFFQISEVADPSLQSGNVLFLPIETLLGIERYRDDPTITEFNQTQAQTRPENYASFRLYAATIFDVADILTALKNEGRSVRALNAQTDTLIKFSRNANLVFFFISSLALAGLFVALASNMRSLVEQQRTQVSVLAMLGMTATARSWIPHIQSLLILLISVLLTLVITVPAISVINRLFSESAGMTVARIAFGQAVVSVLLLTGLSVVGAFWASHVARSIQAKECIYRD